MEIAHNPMVLDLELMPPSPCLTWQKPPPGFLKCNIDAAFHEDQNLTSLAYCWRNDHGVFLGAMSSWVPPLLPVCESEAMTLLSTLHWAVSMNKSYVIFEMD